MPHLRSLSICWKSIQGNVFRGIFESCPTLLAFEATIALPAAFEFTPGLREGLGRLRVCEITYEYANLQLMESMIRCFGPPLR